MNVFTIVFLIIILSVKGQPTKLLRHVLFAPQNLKYSNAIIFDRNQGEINKEFYQRAYGFQGECLVEAYGMGYTKKKLEDMGYL